MTLVTIDLFLHSEFIAMHNEAYKTALAVNMKMVLFLLLILMIILVMKRIFVLNIYAQGDFLHY
jgi:hypothetical protein